MNQHEVAALFVRADSCYKTMAGVDCWDMARDARLWPGGCPVVAHPPCRAWGQLSHMAKPRPDEKDLARWAVAQVRQWTGVLEHPVKSKLWTDQALPAPGCGHDKYGGWTFPIHQDWFGHRAQKKTLLYIVGISPMDLPDVPYTMGEATHVIASSRRASRGHKNIRPWVTLAEREHTPPELVIWLVELARRCGMNKQKTAIENAAELEAV